MHELADAYRRGVRWSLVGSLSTALLQFIQLAVFARLAGPEAGGDFALAATFMAFLSPVAEAGLSQAVVQAAHIRASDLALLGWINWITGALLCLGVWFSGPLLSNYFHRQELPGLLLFMSATLLVTPFGAQYSGLLSRELDFRSKARIDIVSWALSVIVTSALALSNWGPWAMAAGFFTRNIYSSLGNIWIGRRILKINPLKISYLQESTALLRFGVYEFASRWADFFSNYLDKLIVAALLGATALGYYSLALSFLMLPTARLAFVVTRVTFPLVAKVQGDKTQVQSIYERTSKEVILLLFPVYLGIALFAKEIMLLGFGEAWLPAAPLFMAFGLAGLVRSLSASFPQLLKGLGKPQIWLQWILLLSSALFLGLLGFVSLYPFIETAAWARMIVEYFVEIPLLFLLARWIGVQFTPALRFAVKTLGYLAPAVIICYILQFWVTNFYNLFILKSIFYITSVILILFFSPLKTQTRELLKIFYRSK